MPQPLEIKLRKTYPKSKKMDGPNTNKIQAHLSQFILMITKKTKILSVK